MKRVVFFFCVALVLSACDELLSGGSGSSVKSDILESEHWSVCGMKAPRDYQELNRFSYDYAPENDEDGYVGAEADFKDGKMTIVFPSGAYRVLDYVLSDDRKSIVFDKVFHHGYDGAADVKACKVAEDKMNIGEIFSLLGYRGLKTDDSHFIAFYQGSSLNGVDMSKGEWRLNFVSGHLKDELVKLYEIDCEYGTAVNPIRIMEGGPAWSHDFVDTLAVFPWREDIDLAKIYYGPGWRLPLREEAQELLDGCTHAKINMVSDGVTTTGVYFKSKAEGKSLYMESLPQSGECGFWLADGSAFIFGYDSKNQSFARISDDVAGRSFRILPVQP